MADLTDKFIEIFLAFDENPNAKLICPKCNENHLGFEVIDFKDSQGNLTDKCGKNLVCPKCGWLTSARCNRE